MAKISLQADFAGTEFEANARPNEGKFTLDQPNRLNLMVRA